MRKKNLLSYEAKIVLAIIILLLLIFLPIPFLIGLGIVPIAVLLTKLVIKSEVSQ